MYQLTQKLKSGHMEILEAPFPALIDKQVLVRNHYSVISPGTEGKTISDARKGYIAKALSRQKEVKQVIEMIKTQGFKQTYKTVMNKLEVPSPLGYSCAGEVIATPKNISNFKVGDLVACGGNNAVHADIVSVPFNLCVKIPVNVDLKQAAFATIASIALQGIRQAELKLGEHCIVLGLGLIGQLTLILLEVAGIRTIGLDINEQQINLAKKVFHSEIYNRNQSGLEQIINNDTNGIGTDAVIITAGTTSLDPVNFAGEICRKKGKVVIVGAVPTGFERKNYYHKELDLRMSCSYGPGRYDTNYEEKGIDYPAGYVRWTENRNMQAFIDLLSSKKIDIKKLITHTFPLEQAPEAYNMILKKSEPFTGILIQYDNEKKLEKAELIKEKTINPQEANVGFIGAGNFAQNILLPNLKGMCNLIGVATAESNISKYVGVKFGFQYCTGEAAEILADKNVNTIFIATRHNLHAKFVIDGLKAGKNIFVEKPLAITPDELYRIKNIYSNISSKKAKESSVRLMVGFNRRFSAYTKEIKNLLDDNQPKSINMRINAGMAPADHWLNDPEIGGGRIIGEVCHFIDLAMHISGSKINSVAAHSMNEPEGLNNTVTINLSFDNGSIANIAYFSNGNKNLSKEYIEIFCGGTVAIINDFKKLTIYGKRKKIIKGKQDKGHFEELKQFINSIKKGIPSPIPFDELYNSTQATFTVLESIQNGRKIQLGET